MPEPPDWRELSESYDAYPYANLLVEPRRRISRINLVCTVLMAFAVAVILFQALR